MPGSVNFYLSGWSFPSFRWSPLVRVLIHIGDPCRYVYFSLYVSLSSVPLSCELYPSSNPIFSALPLQFKETASCCLGFTACTVVWKVSQGNKLGQQQGFLVCLPTLRPDAFVVWCPMSWKILFQLFYLFHDCFRSKVNSVPVISSFKEFF